MKKENLRIDNLRKEGLLKRVQFQIFAGEIMHCIFDNIQEKQLFLQVICGKEKADYGKVYIEEQFVTEQEVASRLDNCVAIVSIESQLITSITTDENMFLMRPKVKNHWVRNRDYKKQAHKLFEEFELSIEMEKPVFKLTDFEKVQVEIMKAYLLGKQVIILTDLSNCLSSIEKRKLWVLLDELRKKGKSIVMIEPLEDMYFSKLDVVTVMKHGRTCFMKSAKECDYTMLHTILYRDEMGKRAESAKFSKGRMEEADEKEIIHQNLSSSYLKNISLQIKKGQIIKMFCVDEKSYKEVVKALREDAFSQEGISIAEGNPAASTLFMELTVMDNLKMLLAKKANGMWLVPRYKKSIRILLKEIIPEELYGKLVKELSPHDIQKVLYARWLLYSPKLLVCIQPFADGDIKARETAREMIYILEARKIPVLIVTSNTAELNYCQGEEVYVRHGRLVGKEDAYYFLNKDT